MLKNYFIIAFRALWKNKVFSVINILGLAIGISASLVIYLLVDYHFTFDRFEKDNNRIYRVVSNFSFSGQAYYNSGVHDPLPAAVKNEVTGVDAVVPFRTWNGDAKISVQQPGKNEWKIFKHQEHIVFVDTGYFDLVNYTWIAGSRRTAFLNPYQAVLTESKARLYFPQFGAAEIIGKQFHIDDTITATITGIVKDLEDHSDFTFNTFIAYSTLERTSLKPENWESWNSTNGAQQLYVKLSAGITTSQIEKQLAQIYNKYHTPDPEDHSTTSHVLQPLSDIHFNTDYGSYGLPLANKPTLYGLMVVAAFLLVLGCINFINLTTAHASQRAREIGIRKTMGGSRRQVITQFLLETFLLTLVATLLSVMLTPLILKAFSGFIPEQLQFSLTGQPGLIPFLLLLTTAVSLLSGFYPALILSGYRPVLVLKNQAFANTGKTRNAWLRKILTISQFAIAQVFIMATILVGKQIHFSLSKDMGFKKDAILYMNTNYYDTVRSNKYVFMNKLKEIPEVSMVSLCTNPPSSNSTWTSTVKYKDGEKEVETDVQLKFGDTNYIHLYHLKLLAGKNFAQTDTVTAFLINRTYARILGFQQPELALGKRLKWENKHVAIVGVVNDFNQKSLHEPVKPLAIASWANIQRNISVALQPQNESGSTWKTAVSKIEQAWKSVYPGDDFEYHFLDEEIEKYYTAEKNISSLLAWATGLAVFISCLGLLGLVIYTTTQRTKEIGVRKVLGASVLQIVSMISRDFVTLVLLAFVIAAPVAWLGMNKWLENFAYRTEINWWIFVLSACFMLAVALITLGFQTIRAAIANPVKSLRTE